jgi:hypothetical protein
MQYIGRVRDQVLYSYKITGRRRRDQRRLNLYSETSIHRFWRGSEKETIDAGAIVEIGFAQGP